MSNELSSELQSLIQLLSTGDAANIELAIMLSKQGDGALYKQLYDRYFLLFSIIKFSDYPVFTKNQCVINRLFSGVKTKIRFIKGGYWRDILHLLADFPNLNEVDLSYQNIYELPKNIGQILPNLCYLNLNHNHLERLPKSIINMQDLQSLHIEGNPIISAPIDIPIGCSLYSDNEQTEKFFEVWNDYNITWNWLPF